MTRARRAAWAVLLLAVAAASARQSAGPALIPNGSFETVSGSTPEGWSTHTWGGQARFSLADEGRTGARSVRIDSDAGADAAWHRTATLRSWSRYRLTAWIRTQGVAAQGDRGALINLHGRPEHTRAVTGTRDWTRVEMEFDSGADDAVQVNCLLGYHGLARGTAWFDDVSLELLSTHQPAPAVTIDATAPGEPISKYLYSQFIEHLGRCIYGGIWAEMLEDRKFFYPPGNRDSPWKVFGGARVEMDRQRPFVGDQSPQITVARGAPGGIRQEGLALVAGRPCTGHIWLAGDTSAAPVTVALAWGDSNAERLTVRIPRLGGRWTRTSLRFAPPASADNARLEIASSGTGSFRVGTVSLMPADNVRGMRSDTLRLLKELNAPLYRWPGGNFVSGYDWRDGIGDRDRRPPRKNPAWLGVEHNDFGMHEFMDFCREVGAEPLVVVNTGFGDSHSAMQEVEYANGPPSSPMGRWRARNGHGEPFRVKWWGVGNEMYGPWQLGHMALDQYIIKHNEFVDRMRKVDPTIKVVAVGDAGRWSEGMLRNAADRMDLISEHFYVQERPGVASHVAQVPAAIRAKAEAHRRYRQTIPGLASRDIRIAMDEWNYWYGPHVFGELGTRYFVKDGLGIAAGLHEYFRNTDIIFMANYAQTVNVIGAIKTSRTTAAFETTGLVLKLYRDHWGTIPLRVSGSPPPVDVAAALTEDRRTLTLGIVNPTGEAQTVKLAYSGIRPGTAGRAWRMANPDPMAHNDPSDPHRVRIEPVPAAALGDSVTVPPYSVTVYAVPAGPQAARGRRER